MQVSQIPRKFEQPFANDAGPSFIQNPIPNASQIGITPGAASLTDGFPPLNFQPITSGGVPPRGIDFNGILFQISGWSQWQSAGGPVFYDATFQANIGGYPNGAVVQSLVVPGNYWQSTVDNNTTNPDAGGAGWINPPGMMGTGHWQHRPVADAIPGWIVSNGTTIGSAASGATQRANADCLLAYQYLWNKFSNTQCPVTGGRGANATADFNANKPIATFDMRSIGVMGADNMGSGASNGLLNNVPVQAGNITTPGSIVGENLHTLIVNELASFTPSGSISVSQNAPANVGAAPFAVQAGNPVGNQTGTPATITAAFSGNPIGGNVAHNTVQRSALVYWFMKL